MATENRLTACLQDGDTERLVEYKKDEGLDRTEAERRLVRAGLVQLGYRDDSADPHDLLTEYSRKIGSVLGLAGMVMLGYGVFGFAEFRYIGFGLIVAGFGLIAGAEFGPAIRRRLAPKGDAEEATA